MKFLDWSFLVVLFLLAFFPSLRPADPSSIFGIVLLALLGFRYTGMRRKVKW